ncbi:hypothetical protein GA0074695_5959 [Micromonospora viridifaciens]|uniref:Lipoprotein n=2 Tax=Micromonospora viridifaciens TaxID=1881 RepID=A0A1C4ZQL9_MICVI|nr:hypothetical protein GA0074695_5959 [Micromonospora viridifaciens]
MILIISAFLIPLSLTACAKNEKSSGETKIFEIDNTREAFGKSDEITVTVRRHYMILHPPKDLAQLKELVEKYDEDHPVEGEVQAKEGKKRVFYLQFYRESEDLPRDWQPDEGYLSTDRIEHHKNDLIASIKWSDADPQKQFYCMDKSKEGKLIKEVHFIGDQLVEVRN